MLKVLQISPTYFSDRSIMGGGERYPASLAKELSGQADVSLISFGDKKISDELAGVPLSIYPATLLRGSRLNPFNLSFTLKIIDANVVHCHQICTMVSDQSCLVGRLLGKKVFLTDHGGGAEVVLHRRLPWIHDQVSVILQSEFARQFIPKRLAKRTHIVKGGVDTIRYSPDPMVAKDGTILFVGRILPHKGINYLIDAFRKLNNPDLKLRIIGRIYSEKYYQALKNYADGLHVEFIHEATDHEVLRAYRQAWVAVLPSVHTDVYGDYSVAPELMGFTLLEAQASGTPVICTKAGAMEEFVNNGVTGWLSSENSSDELAELLKSMLNLSRVDYERMSKAAVHWTKQFSWKSVAAAHMVLYEA